jgi:hypothetical protein
MAATQVMRGDFTHERRGGRLDEKPEREASTPEPRLLAFVRIRLFLSDDVARSPMRLRLPQDRSLAADNGSRETER